MWFCTWHNSRIMSSEDWYTGGKHSQREDSHSAVQTLLTFTILFVCSIVTHLLLLQGSYMFLSHYMRKILKPFSSIWLRVNQFFTWYLAIYGCWLLWLLPQNTHENLPGVGQTNALRALSISGCMAQTVRKMTVEKGKSSELCVDLQFDFEALQTFNRYL